MGGLQLDRRGEGRQLGLWHERWAEVYLGDHALCGDGTKEECGHLVGRPASDRGLLQGQPPTHLCTVWWRPGQSVHLWLFAGAIAVSYIGLADDEIAAFWKGFFTHDHFDGETQWGYPESDRASALVRLARLKGRPVLVCGTSASRTREAFLGKHLELARFTFLDVPTDKIFNIPEGKVIHPHTDLWMHKDSTYRRQARAWIERVLEKKTKEQSRHIRTTPLIHMRQLVVRR